jgi:hypothetical protein
MTARVIAEEKVLRDVGFGAARATRHRSREPS